VFFGKNAKDLTEDTSKEIKSKTINLSTATDTKKILKQGVNVDNIVSAFEDTTMSEIRESKDITRRKIC